MTARYLISPDVAWLDGADGGRELAVAWVARLDTGESFALCDGGWIVWVLLSEGHGTADEIRTESARLGAEVEFGENGLEDFLESLVARGAATRSPV